MPATPPPGRPGSRRASLRALLTVTAFVAFPAFPAAGAGAAQVPSPDPVATAEGRVDALRAGGDRAALAQALQNLGTALTVAGRPEDALEAFRSAIEEARSAGDSVGLAAAHNSLGRLYWTFSDYASALENLLEARDIRVALGDRVGLGPVLNNIGVTHYQGGNYEPALQAFLQSLELRREAGDLRGEALVLTNIGRTYQDWGQFERAFPSLQEAVQVADRLGEPAVRGYALHNLGMLEMDRGNHDRARELFRSSMELYETHPQRTASDSLGGRVLNLSALGLLQLREGDATGSIALLEGLLAEAERDTDQRRRARILLNLGYAYRAAGQAPEARRSLEQALELSRTYTQRTMALEALSELAALEEDAGDSRSALGHLRSYNALRDSVFSQGAAQAVAAMEARAETERQERENARLLDEQAAQEAVIARQRLVGGLGTVLLLLAAGLVGVMVHFNRLGREREETLARTNEALERVNGELRVALSEVRTLKGLIPICASCKKIRDDSGYWEGVESYIMNRSDAVFSHAICTDCGPKLYGADWEPGSEPEVAQLDGVPGSPDAPSTRPDADRHDSGTLVS